MGIDFISINSLCPISTLIFHCNSIDSCLAHTNQPFQHTETTVRKQCLPCYSQLFSHPPHQCQFIFTWSCFKICIYQLLWYILPFNLLPPVYYYILPTVYGMVLIYLRMWLPRYKHPSCTGEIVSPYRNLLVLTGHPREYEHILRVLIPCNNLLENFKELSWKMESEY